MTAAEQPADSHTQLLEEREVRAVGEKNVLSVEEPDRTGGIAFMAGLGLTDLGSLPAIGPFGSSDRFRLASDRTRLIFILRGDTGIGAWPAQDLEGRTFSLSAPEFSPIVGTGDIAEFARGLWRGSNESRSILGGSEVALVDVPAVLREARSLAGLPVQDLAAMFGIGRRQFYNLASGDQNTDDERAPRIARITGIIREVSKLARANSRKTRLLLLARLGGDSIYSAAVADDTVRLSQAVERAQTAVAQDQSVPNRLPPSARATADEALAVREYLRASRDEMPADD